MSIFSFLSKIIARFQRSLSFLYSNLCLNRVTFWLKKEEYQKALVEAKKAEVINNKYLSEYDERYFTLYFQFAFIYNRIKEYENSLLYAQKCLIVEEKYPIDEATFKGDFYSLIAINYEALKDYTNAILYLQKALLDYRMTFSDTDEQVINALMGMNKVLVKAKITLPKKEYNEYKKWFDDLIKEINSNLILKE